jgi:natural product precursor
LFDLPVCVILKVGGVIMKKKMGLTALYENSMKELKESAELKAVTGGNSCGCACYYANSGGLNTTNNCSKNTEDNLFSPHPVKCFTDGEFIYIE